MINPSFRLRLLLQATFLFSLLGQPSFVFGQVKSLPPDLGNDVLGQILIDSLKVHEGQPLGVPRSYDWALQPRVRAGNSPTGFAAATGWGQAFYAQSNAVTPTQVTMGVRRFMTFICTGDSYSYEWHLAQEGAIDGRQFRADFAGNSSQAAAVFRLIDDHYEISFAPGKAFHFWPSVGRFDLPSQTVCGFLVLLQARQIGAHNGGLLVGLGADYWTDRSVGWDNYKTNRDVAIGRLKLIDDEWRWFGMTTANADALIDLQTRGYINLKRK